MPKKAGFDPVYLKRGGNGIGWIHYSYIQFIIRTEGFFYFNFTVGYTGSSSVEI